jgi:TolB-like protein/DNA-binding winged helix-turn-helix (wHTH) protein
MRGPGIDRQYVRFATFTVDLVSRELWNDGQKVPLQEKPFQILAILLEHAGQLVTREELQHKLWPADTFVDFEHSINTAIKKVRETLGDSGDHPRFIETLPRRGYRFIAPIERSGEHHAATQPIADPLGTDSVVDPQPQDLDRYLGSLETAVHGEQSVGQKASRRHRFLLVGAGILVLTVVAASIWYKYARRNAPALTSAPSIAVLPFADLSPGHDQEYLSDGLAEEILNDLTRIPDLKVVARTSAFQFKGRYEDSRVIGQKLNVVALLEGSVRREGSHLRITVQLIKATDGFHLWSESFDRDLKDVIAVEDDIAASVTSALQPKLLGRQTSASLLPSQTTNPEAYEAFLERGILPMETTVNPYKRHWASLTRQSS